VQSFPDGRDPLWLIVRQQLCRSAPSGLIIEIDIGELLASALLHHQTFVAFLE
jgi:hypothetical protein